MDKIRFFILPLILAALVAGMLPSAVQPAHAAGGIRILRDTEIEHALLKIIRPMAGRTVLGEDGVDVRVVIDPDYNAFVTGDGNIYIHSGLILKAESPLEVAGVLAHELGHLAANHVGGRIAVGQQAGAKAGLIAIAGVTAGLLAGSGEATAAGIGVAIGAQDQALREVLAHSRQDENEADGLAIRLMEAEMLSLAPMAQAMRRIGRQRLLPEGRQSDYYLTHPGAQERSAAIQDHINRHEHEAMPPPQWMVEDFARIRAKLGAWTQANPGGGYRGQISDSRLDDDVGAIATAINARFAGAISAFRAADLARADTMLAELTADFPGDAYLHEFRGQVLFAAGRPAEAAAQYTMALELLAGDEAVNRGQILLALGRALIATGEADSLPRAITALEEAVRLEPEWVFVKKQLGIGYGKAGRIAEADLTLAEAAMLARDRPLALQLARRAADNPQSPPTIRQRALDIIARSDNSGGDNAPDG